jgi:hypothetical protein
MGREAVVHGAIKLVKKRGYMQWEQNGVFYKRFMIWMGYPWVSNSFLALSSVKTGQKALPKKVVN